MKDVKDILFLLASDVSLAAGMPSTNLTIVAVQQKSDTEDLLVKT
jgi:hypothetical protein